MNQTCGGAPPIGRWKAIVQVGQRALASADIFTPQWAYVFRSVLAAVLAYAVAYTLRLDTPYSAANSVILVTHMNQGIVLAKGRWRFLGTLIGGAIAILLMGVFIQAPMLFLLCFGLWLGICSAASTVLRHFWATGVAVAGYTVGFATYGALEAPEHALSIVLARTATVAVGVMCLGLVTALLTKRATRTKLEAAVSEQSAQVGRLLLHRMQDQTDVQRHSMLDDRLVSELFAIDDLLELSRHESPDVAMSAGWVREGMASLFSSALGASEMSIETMAKHPAFANARAEIGAALPKAIALIQTNQLIKIQQAVALVAKLRRELRETIDTVDSVSGESAMLVSLDPLLDAVEDWEHSLVCLVKLLKRSPSRKGGFRFNRDWQGGLRNGIRAVVAIVLGGTFGIVTGWQDWSILLLLLAPYSAVLAMTGNPVSGAVSFVKGTFIGILPAYLFLTLVIPNIQGFPLLMVSMMPFWIVGFYASTKPQHAFTALGYLVAFNTLIGATNPMVIDALSSSHMSFSIDTFFNKALGWMVAVVATWLALKLILPHAPHKQADRIADALRNDVKNVVRKGFSGRRRVWEHLQHHRLAGIALSLKSDPGYASKLLREGLTAIYFGRAALQLHHMRSSQSIALAIRALANDALIEVSSLLSKMKDTEKLEAIREAVLALKEGDEKHRRAIHRTATAIVDMKHLVTHHRSWLESEVRES